MPEYLGLDTSNYTTSCAIYDSDTGSIRQEKQLLPVRAGEAGLRQSDAVFHHTRQLPQVMERLLNEPMQQLKAIGVTIRPRNAEGSYMPCFLCGQGAARMLSAVNGAAVYETSHQIGHVLAALYSAGKLSLLKQRFLAFHVSGGTTDCLLCEPDEEQFVKVTQMGTSLDLKAGQLIDRVGLMMNLQFPCGIALEQLAAVSSRKWKVRPVLKGENCCLSGAENQCQKLLKQGESYEDVARYCLLMVQETVAGMTRAALQTIGENLPVMYAGGVMSNQLIREPLKQQFDAYFAEPAFSCDNAAGAAIYAAIRDGGIA